AMVTEAVARGRRVIVVTDTVFSMDGDTAPIAALIDICTRHRALLVVDEAHAVLGPDPALDGVDHIRVGTLSKTLGSLGGFAACWCLVSARRPCRRAPAAYGWPFRRPTPMPTSPGCGRRWPSLARPRQLVVIVGTGTGVGKTWVAARRLAALRIAGATVAARK